LTLQQFIHKVEAYYGAQYSVGQKPFIITYLSDRSERALDFTFAETLKTFSSQYGKCPDISIFEKMRGEVRDRLEHDYSQNLSAIAITETAGNNIDVSAVIDNLEKWVKERGET
jgi:hypothetical protein